MIMIMIWKEGRKEGTTLTDTNTGRNRADKIPS
jgi:hypothetical protein